MTQAGYVPKSCNFNLPLIATRDVGKSEDYNTIQANLSGTFEGIAKQLVPFIIQVHELNRINAWEMLVRTHACILTFTARIFVTHFDLIEYDEHQAVMDLLVLQPGLLLGLLASPPCTFSRLTVMLMALHSSRTHPSFTPSAPRLSPQTMPR